MNNRAYRSTGRHLRHVDYRLSAKS